MLFLLCLLFPALGIVVAAAAAVNAADSSSVLPWSCSASAAVSVRVTDDFSYSVSVANSTWLEGGDVVISVNRTFLSREAGTLKAAGNPVTSNGTDAALGAWSAISFSWVAPELTFPFVTTIKCYAGLVEFEQKYATGASGIATWVDGAPHPPALDNFNSSTEPGAHFPSFEMGPQTQLSGLSHIEWAGEFSWHQSNWGVGWGNYVGGQLGGPVVLHPPHWSRGAGRAKPIAAMVGPLSEFKSSILARTNVTSGQQRWVFGPHGHFNTLPVGFSTRCGLVAPSGVDADSGLARVFSGESGITAAVYAYGRVLRAIHNTQRFLPAYDVGVTGLSYWYVSTCTHLSNHI